MALILYRPEFWIALILVGILFVVIARSRHLHWWPAWILRMLMIVLILMGILTPDAEFLTRTIPEREVMIVDLSDSIAPQAYSMIRETAQVWRQQGANKILIVYGDQAFVTYPDEGALPGVDGRANNLEGALQLASGILGKTAGRLILATDGAIAASDVLEEMLQTFADQGHQVDWLPLAARADSADGYLGQLWAPRNLWQGMPFHVTLPVSVAVPLDDIKFYLKVNGVEVKSTPRSLAGAYIDFLIPAQREGITTLEVRADIPSDPNVDNNAAFLTVQVHKEPSVLFVTGEDTSVETLGFVEAMNQTGIIVDIVLPLHFPSTLELLSKYQVIFLDDILASELTQEQMLALKVFVSKLGGGLVFLGGRNSYTLGGYKNSLLEPMLPVKLEPPPRPQRPPIVFILVIDHSTSMSIGLRDGKVPMDLAREAAMRALETLKPDDFLGVLTFTADYKWNVPLRQIGSGLELRNALDAVSRVIADGSTKMFAALSEAISQVNTLPDTAPSTVSILLLSDGESWDGNVASFSEMARTAYEQGIQISTIALGRGADKETMQAIANNGKGRYYHVLLADDLPRVMIQESEAIRGENIQEGETNLVMSLDNPDHPILTGLSLDNLPLITSYNALMSKSDEGAEDVLVSANFGDPILSIWQFGLGRVAAWVVDTGEEWTGRWASADAQGAFWSQVVRYALPQPGIQPASVDIAVEATTLTITANILDASIPEAARNLNLVEVKFSFADAEKNIHAYFLSQVAPGQYQLVIPRPPSGAYRAVLEYTAPEGEKEIPVLLEVNTPPEWLPIRQDESAYLDMKLLLAENGGQLVSFESLSAPVEVGDPETEQTMGLHMEWWKYVLFSLIIFWPLEIAIRRRWLPWM